MGFLGEAWFSTCIFKNWLILAQDVAVIPVSSAATERAFSKYTGILTNLQKKSRNKVQSTNMIRMIHTCRINQEKRSKNTKTLEGQAQQEEEIAMETANLDELDHLIVILV